MKKMASTTTIMSTHAIDTESEQLRGIHAGCFACGLSNQRGLALHFEVNGQGIAHADWQPKAEFLSYPDRVHGGVIATLLDSAMVHALFARGVAGVTAEMTIRYKHYVSFASPVSIIGWVESVKHGIYLCRAEVSQNDKLVVWARAKFMALDYELPATSK